MSELIYNAVLSDCDITGIAEEEFLDWLGYERREVLSNAVTKNDFTNTDIIPIDLTVPYSMFKDIVKEDIDTDTIFKILVEYVILFRHSSNTESLGEYLTFHLENETLGYDIALSTERLFKELIVYISKFEVTEDTLIPYTWIDDLHRLIVISKKE